MIESTAHINAVPFSGLTSQATHTMRLPRVGAFYLVERHM